MRQSPPSTARERCWRLVASPWRCDLNMGVSKPGAGAAEMARHVRCGDDPPLIVHKGQFRSARSPISGRNTGLQVENICCTLADSLPLPGGAGGA
ncbi:MAG: hypothetical protein U5M50_06750 [Sphingobium sp.]|nr:hypothetical protein [Sphingobium sp.]